MAPAKDPFLWDVEDVVLSLCRPRMPWSPDPALLATKIRDEEVNGRLFLTSERTLSKEDLMKCLGIDKFRHKAALAEELTRLRSESPLYKKWDRDFTRMQQMDDIDEALDTMMAKGLATSSQKADDLLPSNEGTAAPQPSFTPSEIGKGLGRALGRALLQQTVDGRTTKLEAPTINQSERPGDLINGDGEASIEPSPKRRRVAPINTSAQPFTTRLEISHPWETSSWWSYLGRGELPMEDIRSASTQISTRVINHRDGGFTVAAPNHLPPGRRLAVSQVMRQLFRKNGRREALARQGLATSESVVDDEELDLADLSDWDEQTWQEVLEEEEDNERARGLDDRYLAADRVEAILESAVEEMRQRWEEKKLLRHQRQAYKIWNAAARRGNKVKQTLDARRQVLAYESRITRLSDRIKSERWKDEKEVKLQAQCLEQSVEDKLYQSWLVSLLESREPPPKPHVFPQPRPKKERKRVVDPDDEVLTSTDEEDGFIVPDDFPAASTTPIKNSTSDLLVTPIKNAPPILDLTLSTGRRRKTHKPATEVVDLTNGTPTRGESRPPHTDDPPSLEDIDVEAIAAVGRKHPVIANDRWRLVVYILRHLTHERRKAVLTRITTSDDEELWSHCIQGYIAGQFLSTEDIDGAVCSEGFDLTRTFLCFVYCRYISDDRLVPPKDKHTRKLQDSRTKAMFSRFCNFIRNIVDLFPQDSQIIDTSQFDEMVVLVESDEELARTDDPGTPRNRSAWAAKKQIVQDRDAVRLREREKLRGQEQEARRQKLRLTLANDIAAQDKTRLIVNESKEEGQSLIYINGEIGKQIKDHQIEGIRFLWNQIIQDKDIRQGCLLAHTMGLGKTMQVITFLVAVAEASASHDPATRSQIPEDLRSSRTLILCPSGLVENWMDEILRWAPGGLLGPLRQLDSSIKVDDVRKEVVQAWVRQGGVLISGYPMFQRVLKIDQEVESMILKQTIVVVADEAHRLKNPDAAISKACARLATPSRIALTGSPLANNVEEYYAMINWVAPNFLGPIDEFRSLYAREIHAGCYKDSDGYDKRKALVRLRALGETVAPKVNRATVKSCLMNDLPAKSEYVITLTPTDLQVRLYNQYIAALGGGSDADMEQGRIFNIVNDLGLICNHPSCFETKVQKARDGASQGYSTFYNAFPRDLIETSGMSKTDPSLSLKTRFLMMILDEARRSNDKVLVFSQSLTLLDYLEALLRQQKRRLWRLDGQTKIQSRQDLTKSFNKGDIDIGLISTTAGGVGLNIQGANRVVIFDSRWNPVDVQQAVGRAYRIGQQKKVFVYHLIVSGTFEENIHNRAVFKQQLAQRVVDKQNPISWSQRKQRLIHPVKERPRKDVTKFTGKDHILDSLIAYRYEGHPDQQLITDIVLTDTFDEEDPTHTLTEGEKQEAERMVSLNRLRLTDPGKFESMRGAQQMQSLTNTHGHSAATASSTTAPPPSTVPPPSTIPPPSTAPVLSTTANPNRSPHVPPSSNPAQGIQPIALVSQSMDGAHDGYGHRVQQSTWQAVRDDARQIPGLPSQFQPREWYQQGPNGAEPPRYHVRRLISRSTEDAVLTNNCRPSRTPNSILQ